MKKNFRVYYCGIDHLDYDSYVDAEYQFDSPDFCLLLVRQTLTDGRTRRVSYNKDSWVKVEEEAGM